MDYRMKKLAMTRMRAKPSKLEGCSFEPPHCPTDVVSRNVLDKILGTHRNCLLEALKYHRKRGPQLIQTILGALDPLVLKLWVHDGLPVHVESEGGLNVPHRPIAGTLICLTRPST
jgi:hypothetical protein